MPDAKGRTIPPTATRGQVHWSIRGAENLVMIGRAEQVDITHGLASSYACQNCCPDSFYDAFSTSCGVPTFPTETTQLIATERDRDCYGTLLDAYEIFPFDWFSYNIGIASVDGGGLAQGESAGNTTIQSSWWVTTWQYQPVYNSCNSSWQQVVANAVCQIAQCSVPVNFRQVGNGTDIGGGTLHFDYAWDSSTGNLADLSNCTVGEIVSYPSGSPPSPPFPVLNLSNPTVIDLAATAGGLQDNHSTPGSFVRPYSASSFVATQFYRYKCPCRNGGSYVNLVGPINITRSVSQNSGGSWKFTITKSSASATINPLP